MSRVIGAGMQVITVLILIMEIGNDILPAEFINIFTTVTIIDCAVRIVLLNTICRK